MIFSAEYWEKNNFLSQEYQDFVSITIFLGTSFEIEYFEIKNKSFFAFTSSSHL